jgi:hypothetical protein
MRLRRGSITNVKDLKAALKEEWGLLEVDYLKSLVASMSRRCQTVIEAKGGNTKY